MRSHTIRLVTTLSDFEVLSDAWTALPDARSNPLLSHDWFCAAAGTMHRDQRLLVATVWRGSALVAAAPLVEVRRGGVKRLEFIGSTPLYEPCNLLFLDSDALRELVSCLVALRRPMALQRIPIEPETTAMIRSTGTGRLVNINGPSYGRVDLVGSWDQYLASRSSECRAGFPRKRRKLASEGVLAFECLRPCPSETAGLMDEFVKVEGSGWKLNNRSALASRPLMQAFFREVSRRFASRGEVRFCFLRCGNQTIAARLGLQYGSRIWGLKIGYDERWRTASPGTLLLWESLREAYASGAKTYEFLGVTDGQLATWSTSEVRLQTIIYYPHSIDGAMAAAVDLCGAAARRATRHVSALHSLPARNRQLFIRPDSHVMAAGRQLVCHFHLPNGGAGRADQPLADRVPLAASC
jgi:CelD/BcsL family acetyltransferase involved in cellulose biosynthesis